MAIAAVKLGERGRWGVYTCLFFSKRCWMGCWSDRVAGTWMRGGVGAGTRLGYWRLCFRTGVSWVWIGMGRQ